MQEMSLKQIELNSSIEASETTFIVRTLKGLYPTIDTDSLSIIFVHYLDKIFNDPSLIKHVKQIPIKIDFDGMPNLTVKYPPTSSDNRLDCRGLSELIIKTPRKDIRVWKFLTTLEVNFIGPNVILIEKDNLKHLYRLIVTLSKQSNHTEPPILPTGMLQEIYDNSIGFLKRGRKDQTIYRKYNIPYKRGILLSGKPGSGKTLTCKWLRYMCQKENIPTKIITLEDYKIATNRNDIARLFSLPKKKQGLMFFDDMDIMVKNRNKTGDSFTLHTFLTNLDGIELNEGGIFIFTTNVLQDLDEAFVRPGRIDLFMTFKEPGEELRRTFIKQKFDEEILKEISIEDIVKRTDQYSYAELEEIRKLIVLDLLDKKAISVEKTFSLFEKHRKDFQERASLGFRPIQDEDEEESYF